MLTQITKDYFKSVEPNYLEKEKIAEQSKHISLREKNL